MNNFSANFHTFKPEQFGSIIVTLLVAVVLVVVVACLRIKKQDPEKAPSLFRLVLEKYITFFEHVFQDVSDGKIDRSAPYIFGLANFLLIGNMLALFGLEPISGVYSVTLTLALITWIGTTTLAIIHQKLTFFIKLLNPLEVVGRVAPLISLSFRLFGNIMGGNVVLFLVYFLTFKLQSIMIASESNYLQALNLLSILVMPFLRAYFDFFDGILQAYIFVVLTTTYWSFEILENASKVLSKKAEDEDIVSLTYLQEKPAN